MGPDEKQAKEAVCVCPLCKAMNAYKTSEAATHLRGIRREAAQLVRCLASGAIRKVREHLGSTPGKS